MQGPSLEEIEAIRELYCHTPEEHLAFDKLIIEDYCNRVLKQICWDIEYGNEFTKLTYKKE